MKLFSDINLDETYADIFFNDTTANGFEFKDMKIPLTDLFIIQKQSVLSNCTASFSGDINFVEKINKYLFNRLEVRVSVYVIKNSTNKKNDGSTDNQLSSGKSKAKTKHLNEGKKRYLFKGVIVGIGMSLNKVITLQLASAPIDSYRDCLNGVLYLPNTNYLQFLSNYTGIFLKWYNGPYDLPNCNLIDNDSPVIPSDHNVFSNSDLPDAIKDHISDNKNIIFIKTETSLGLLKRIACFFSMPLFFSVNQYNTAFFGVDPDNFLVIDIDSLGKYADHYCVKPTPDIKEHARTEFRKGYVNGKSFSSTNYFIPVGTVVAFDHYNPTGSYQATAYTGKDADKKLNRYVILEAITNVIPNSRIIMTEYFACDIAELSSGLYTNPIVNGAMESAQSILRTDKEIYLDITPDYLGDNEKYIKKALYCPSEQQFFSFPLENTIVAAQSLEDNFGEYIVTGSSYNSITTDNTVGMIMSEPGCSNESGFIISEDSIILASRKEDDNITKLLVETDSATGSSKIIIFTTSILNLISEDVFELSGKEVEINAEHIYLKSSDIDEMSLVQNDKSVLSNASSYSDIWQTDVNLNSSIAVVGIQQPPQQPNIPPVGGPGAQPPAGPAPQVPQPPAGPAPQVPQPPAGPAPQAPQPPPGAGAPTRQAPPPPPGAGAPTRQAPPPPPGAGAPTRQAPP
ncbi:MAG: hypothetical protein KFW09_05085, partial [Oscillospiraceae bacterium]|nr:hypothetical protein [Oscillospiraceae bacterium]